MGSGKELEGRLARAWVKQGGEGQDQGRCDLRHSSAGNSFNLIPQGAGRSYTRSCPNQGKEEGSFIHLCSWGVLIPRHFRLSRVDIERGTPRSPPILAAGSGGAGCLEMITRDPEDCPPIQDLLWSWPLNTVWEESSGGHPRACRQEEFWILSARPKDQMEQGLTVWASASVEQGALAHVA